MIKGFHPQFGTLMEYPCGQCINCRINRRRKWTARMLLQSRRHKLMYYVTLTYNDEYLPINGELDRLDLRRFIKRLRVNVGFPFKYFAGGIVTGKQT